MVKTLHAATVAVAADHAGFRYKECVKTFLTSKGHEVRDFGTRSERPVDYPGIIRPAARAVAAGRCALGVVFGGSGNGEAIVANKIKGVRCAVCWNLKNARLAKEHNDANMIAIGQRMVSLKATLAIVDAWLSARFAGGRHRRRIDAIETQRRRRRQDHEL